MTLVEELGEPVAPPTPIESHKLKRMPARCRGYADVYNPDFLRRMVAPHVESFNFFLGQGIKNILKHSRPYIFSLGDKGVFSFSIKHIEIGVPVLFDERLTPQICREMDLSYQAQGYATFEAKKLGSDTEFTVTTSIGNIPIMVGSVNCALYKKTPAQLIQLREDEREVGGYFLNHGNERIIRMVVIPKAGVPQCMERTAYFRRGTGFTQYAVSYRDRRDDCRSQTIVVHALKDGSACVRVLIDKKEFFVPLCLLLKALKPTTDMEIYNGIVHSETEAYIVERVEMMLRNFHQEHIKTTNEALAYLGKMFRPICFRNRVDLDDESIGREFLDTYMFFSLTDYENPMKGNQAKYSLLCTITRKLYMFTEGKLKVENSDSTANHDVILPGHLFCAVLSELCENMLASASYACMKHNNNGKFEFSEEFFKKKGIFKNMMCEQRFKSLISIGTLNSPSGLDMLQQDSFSVTADRLNFIRFLAHFRSIHRGKFFSEMKTTAVRKMLPDSYGYLCPVHTPDGAPCGLLNHLGYTCSVVVSNKRQDGERLVQLCREYGASDRRSANCVPVLVNGFFCGYMDDGAGDEEGRGGHAWNFVQMLREMKCKKEIDPTTEVIYVSSKNKFQLFPILNLLTTTARYTRPVFNLLAQGVEQISPQEQQMLDIAIFDSEFNDRTTHQELSPLTMLSTVATLIPFPDHNQSPRNMYECQMLKQTMGFSARSIGYRTDSKNYRILTPQRPLVRTCTHGIGGFDTHPTGTNAVVAVLSYSGYDMEDACLINKSSLERGLFNGTVYQCETVNLIEELGLSKYSQQMGYFKRDETYRDLANSEPGEDRTFRRDGYFYSHLDVDGLPKLGTVLTTGDVICQFYDPALQVYRVKRYDSREVGIVEKVILTRDASISLPVIAKIIVRHDRSPIIGDKFASRHGQKGTLGIKFFGRDLPFTSEGITPDLIINPHAFPSRMTIGMLLDSLGGKVSAITGRDTDATPFQYSDDHRALDCIGAELQKHGYCKYGSDILYSGVSGELMPVGIYIGVVYYQRLRHMVNDKYQVRSTGKCDQITHQPVKGRARGGGTRFGEMERDALLAHGTEQLLRGRLCTDSDVCEVTVCSHCGNTVQGNGKDCPMCGGMWKKVMLPMATMVLIEELAGMGINMQLKLQKE